MLLIQLTKGYGVFAHVFFLSSWLFAIVALFSSLFAICCSKRAANLSLDNFLSEPTDHLEANEGQVLMGLIGGVDEDDSDDSSYFVRGGVEDY